MHRYETKSVICMFVVVLFNKYKENKFCNLGTLGTEESLEE